MCRIHSRFPGDLRRGLLPPPPSPNSEDDPLHAECSRRPKGPPPESWLFIEESFGGKELKVAAASSIPGSSLVVFPPLDISWSSGAPYMDWRGSRVARARSGCDASSRMVSKRGCRASQVFFGLFAWHSTYEYFCRAY